MGQSSQTLPSIDPIQTTSILNPPEGATQQDPEELLKKKKAFADMMAQMGQQFAQPQEDAPTQELQGIVSQQRPFEPPPMAMSRQMPLMSSRRNVMGF